MDKLDIALVICPAWGATQPPVGISYLKGFLIERGMRAKCFDLSLELYKVFPEKKYWDLNYPEYFMVPRLFESTILPSLEPFLARWSEEIASNDPRVVGFSLFMSSIYVSILLAKRLKAIRPDLIIVAGGPEVTRIKRVLVDGIGGFGSLNTEADITSSFDMLVDGEGEEALLEILQAVRQRRDFSAIQGGVYIHNGRLTANEPRGLLQDLDTLAPADYSDFELSAYTRESLPLVTSRGCINRCTFCADSPLWKIYRFRSAEKVSEEMGLLAERYKAKGFEIADSTLNGHIPRLERLCDLLIGRKSQVPWSGKAVLRKEMTYELLSKMKQAGCTDLSYGIESGSPGVLKDMRKNLDLTEASRIIKDTQRAGIRPHCFFLIGYPTETEADFQMTLDFITENARFIQSFNQVTGCHIEEDSYLGLNVSKYGIVFKEDGWHSQESTPRIRKERLERFKELARQLHTHYQCEVQL